MCTNCQDKGVVFIPIEGYDHPFWESKHFHVAIPDNEKIVNNIISYHMVMDCQCCYNNPVSIDQMTSAVMDWVSNNLCKS